MKNKLFDAGILIFIGFLIVALGLGTISVGINKANRKSDKEDEKRYRIKDSKLIASPQKTKKDVDIFFQLPMPPEEVPLPLPISPEQPEEPAHEESPESKEPEKSWYEIW